MALYLVPTEKGREIVLDKAVVFIGRHPECDVILSRSRKISRRHCCIAQVNTHFIVRDLGSLNGVRVNGKRVRKELPIEIQDEITIGDLSYTLESRDKPGAGKRKRKAKPKRKSIGKRLVQPPGDVDLSQDVPVPIPDDEEFGELKVPETPDAFPIIDAGDEDEFDDDDDDEFLGSDEYENNGSEVELLSE